MAFCGTLLFYRWTAATPLSEAPSDVQEVLKYFDTTCATLRIPHRVTIKNAQDEGTDCALVNVFGLDDLHYRRLEHCFSEGPVACRIDGGSGLPSSAVFFLPAGGPIINPGCYEMELMDLVKQRDVATLSALSDLVFQMGPHIMATRQKRRWRTDAAQLLAANKQATLEIPVNEMTFPMASVGYLAKRLCDYHLLEADLAARCTVDSDEGACEDDGKRYCAMLMAILQLVRDLMEDVQSKRTVVMMEPAVEAPTVDPRGQTGVAPPPPLYAQPKRRLQPPHTVESDRRPWKRSRE